MILIRIIFLIVTSDRRALLHFTSVGGSPSHTWGDGTQATNLFDKEPLPYGVHLKWFSVAENQFWEVNTLLDQKILEKLSNHMINDVIDQRIESFFKFPTFIINVAPNGFVSIWISGGAETYLLAETQANKIDDLNWDSFSASALQRRKSITRADFIHERFSDTDSLMSTKNDEPLTKGKFIPSMLWKDLMRTYNWSLTINDDFILKDYWAWYINGEKFYTYAKGNKLEKRATPYFISMYIETNNNAKKLIRLNINFDKNEIAEAFESISKKDSLQDPIKLHLNIDPSLKSIDAFIINGKNTIKLENISPSLEDLYNN